MIEKKLSLVISFNKTVDAMAVEEYCLKNNVSGRLIPLPKEISAGCGLAWKCDVSQADEMKKVFKELNVEFDKMSEIVI
ncbi:MAG: DUF3343 domain-containing protein [Lachnospiraceae bacterium]|nr:DUF3343 domain-containing protein [Lachnospiraceae bacterium]